jgi:hypothetical protein
MQVDRRAALWLAATTVVAYVALLGWDQHYDYDPATQTYSGPYQPWQVVTLAALMAVMAATAGWAGQAKTAFVVIPAVLTLIWSFDAASIGDASITDRDSTDANLWPVGAMMLAGVSFAGAWVVAMGASLLRTIRNRRLGQPPPIPARGNVRRTTNGMAIASMVLGILWLNGFGSVLALVLGYVARRQVRERNQAGAGMAIAGIILGWIGVGALGLVLMWRR